jgi:UDP-3-O-[3-hydroxymyristoyl] N-acetylglucosamine deacetylase
MLAHYGLLGVGYGRERMVLTPDLPLAEPVGGAQRTLRNPIGCVGTGLHTGAKVSLSLRPAEVDSGIRIVRYDQPDRTPVPARYDHVCDTTMCTKLGLPGGLTIATIEHLMAALAACEIDNALIELGGPELPIMDGSAQPFVFLIECAGVVEQDQPRRWIEILKPITVCGQNKSARLEPADRFEIDCAIHFDHPLIDHQSLRFTFTPDGFKAEIGRARTFGFAERIEELWSRGLGLGGSLKSAVVVSQDQVLSDGGLRFPDEFVRHKVLDTIGDLYTAGSPIIGRFVGRRAGHTLHNQLLRALFADPRAWRLVTAPGIAEPAVPARRAASA